MRNASYVLLAVLVGVGGGGGGGCSSGPAPESKRQLQSGYQALDRKDYNGAMDAADQFLREHPRGGPGTAEALYLQGRVYEQRAASAEAAGREPEAKVELQNARSTYVRALSLQSPPNVNALIHAGVANTAYFQDDYTTAMNEWAVAYPAVPQPDAQAWMLYRIGLCQQRLGRFDQADHTFAQVRQEFPNSVPAQRAATHQGARAFYVQVGAYADAANADRIVASLQSQKFRAVKTVAAGNRQEVRVGPANTYADAKALRGQLLAAYPGAIIEP